MAPSVTPVKANDSNQITTAKADTSSPTHKSSLSTFITTGMAICLLCVAMSIRTEHLQTPSSTVFDEVHFGGFASRYLNRTFFFDVHPPLGKLIFAAAGYVNGYAGEFSFESIGMKYPPNVPYVFMRGISAFFGAVAVPLVYLTGRAFSLSHQSCVLMSFAVLFDNALATQSRYILLDAPMMGFMFAAVCCWAYFLSVRSKPFTLFWWSMLVTTGFFLGCAASVKLVGLSVVALVGFSTIADLWELISDPAISLFRFTQHFLARAFGLIIVPVMVYLLFFYIHFQILYLPGPGSKLMSARFRGNLEENAGNSSAIFADIAFGSKVVIRHDTASDSFLHSHQDLYPDTQRQQVTIYSHNDENNDWRVLDPVDAEITLGKLNSNSVRYVHEKQLIRLQHVKTGNYLSVVANSRAPASSGFLEVSAIAPSESGTLPENQLDVWRVEFVKQHAVGDNEKRWQTLMTDIRLVHASSGCILQTRPGVDLPKWGFGQQEVSCLPARFASSAGSDTVFVVDQHQNSQIPADAPKAKYRRMSFWEKLIEIHVTMVRANSLLESDHPYASLPTEWPLLTRGILFWNIAGTTGNEQVYLVGNFVAWRLALVAMPLVLLIIALLHLAQQREIIVSTPAIKRVEAATWYIFGGWFLNWAPYFIFQRQLFLHHYLPALIFSIMLIGIFFEALTVLLPELLSSHWRSVTPHAGKNNEATEGQWLEETIRWAMVISVVSIIAWTYSQQRPLIIGLPMTTEYCNALRWIPTWDMECV